MARRRGWEDGRLYWEILGLLLTPSFVSPTCRLAFSAVGGWSGFLGQMAGLAGVWRTAHCADLGPCWPAPPESGEGAAMSHNRSGYDAWLLDHHQHASAGGRPRLSAAQDPNSRSGRRTCSIPMPHSGGRCRGPVGDGARFHRGLVTAGGGGGGLVPSSLLRAGDGGMGMYTVSGTSFIHGASS